MLQMMLQRPLISVSTLFDILWNSCRSLVNSVIDLNIMKTLTLKVCLLYQEFSNFLVEIKTFRHTL